MTARRVVVTGLGVVSPLGVGTSHTWKNLISSKSGITALGPEYDSIPSKVAGLVPTGPSGSQDGLFEPSEWMDKPSIRRIPKFAQFSLAAATQALNDANWHPQSESEREATGTAVGSSIGGIEAFYDNSVAFHTGGYRKMSPLFIPSLLNNMGAGHISIVHGLKGPNHSVSTACTTGAHAIGDAANFIRAGAADVMVAGSSEACVHPLAVAGFARAKSLCSKYNDNPEEASRPFDEERAGFVIGEGAGVMVLEELRHALARGANIYAELVGYGATGDAYHITAPIENGLGALRSMKSALRSARVVPESVDYINAHATSTPLGDVAEAAAIHELFGHSDSMEFSNMSDSKMPFVSSTKGATGHLLGGAGSVEALFTVLSIYHDTLPPTLNLDNPDVSPINHVCNVAKSQLINVAMTNSFGFGGTNASLIFQKYRH